MASALPNSLPLIGPIVGLLGVTAEIVFLTANQLRMVLQIAAVYDREMDLAERMKEMAPVVGGAFGWRALARELVGFVPAIGPGIKGSIAFAGTRVVGEAACWYYQTGLVMDSEERRRIYEDSLQRAGDASQRAENVLSTMGAAEQEQLLDAAGLPAWSAQVFPLGDEDDDLVPFLSAEADAPRSEAPVADAPRSEAKIEPEATASRRPKGKAPRPRISIERNAGRSESRSEEKKQS